MTAWLLVLHLLGLVFWLGPLLVLTRLLAEHSEGSSAETLQVLTRLETMFFNRLAHPAGMVTLLSGIALLFTYPDYFLYARWMHAKLLLVVLLVGLDLWLFKRAGALQAGRERLGRAECAAFGASIAATALAIMILGVVKPF